MENIEKDKVLAAVVRTFFKYFTLGIIEGGAPDNHDMGLYEPKSVKRIMSERIEKVASVFNREAFYAISRINYIEGELESELQAFVAAGNDTSPMGLMRFACRTEECYALMVSEYKRNFESLLCGSFASLAVGSVSDSVAMGEMPVELAESIINRMANQAYTEGKKLA